MEVFKLQIVEKIDEKTVDVSQAQFLGKAVYTPVGMQRQVPVIQTVQKNMEVSPLQFIDKVVDISNVHENLENPQLQHTDQVVDVPVVLVVQFPRMQVVEEAVEIPQLHVIKKIPETVEISQLPPVEKIVVITDIRTVHGTQTPDAK